MFLLCICILFFKKIIFKVSTVRTGHAFYLFLFQAQCIWFISLSFDEELFFDLLRLILGLGDTSFSGGS